MTDDVHKTYAHKAVLTAFSPFFKNVFDSCNVKEHLFLYLDVRTENLLRILDYIYKGEVSVPSSQIEQFIKAASKLKISELIKVKTEDQENVYLRTHAVRSSSSTIIPEEDWRDCQISSDTVEENSTNFSDGYSFQYFRGSSHKNKGNEMMNRGIAYNINAKDGRISKAQKNKIRTEEETPVIKELHEEHDMEHGDAFQHINENPEQHERDSQGVNPDVRIEDFMDLIENKSEGEDKSKIQEHNTRDTLKHQVMSDSDPKAKRPKINASCVHAEFKPARMKHATTKEWIDGSVCSHCGDWVPGKATPNLKSHLKTHDRPVYDKVDGEI